jgi:hypothetical protein
MELMVYWFECFTAVCCNLSHLTPCSPLKDKFLVQGRRKSQARNLLSNIFKMVSCLAYFSNLKMETICSSERLVDLTYPRRQNSSVNVFIKSRL